MKTLILATTFLSVALANQIKVTNNCPFTVWPGIQGYPGNNHPANGGFELGAYKSRSLYVNDKWGGRFFASTKCDASGDCQTADCGGKIECAGSIAIPPATLAEIQLKGARGLDYYFVNLIDGYNLPIQVRPLDGFTLSDYGPYNCKVAGCNYDLNAICPNELAVRAEDGSTKACKSPCLAFNSDVYCCRDYFNKKNGKCDARFWPVNYSAIFKKACPSAFTYGNDKPNPTFYCKGYPNASYEIIFCP